MPCQVYLHVLLRYSRIVGGLRSCIYLEDDFTPQTEIQNDCLCDMHTMVSFCRISSVEAYRIKVVCKQVDSSLLCILYTVITVIDLTKSTNVKAQRGLKVMLVYSKRFTSQTTRSIRYRSNVVRVIFRCSSQCMQTP